MKDNNYKVMSNQLQVIEHNILTITGGDVDKFYDWVHLPRKCEQIEKLIWQRKHLLDRMFVATPIEVKRMEQVNERLYILTSKMYARTEVLYQ